jgi:glycerophosphoryl diester phosphodiesterase
VEIIAHRGASFDAPENTLASIRLAWQQQADAVEIDIHLSKDGKIVVFHDHNTRKTTDVNRKVANQTLAELRGLDAGSWKGQEWQGEKIPTLDEVLALVPPGKRLFIEIKPRLKQSPDVVKALSRADYDPRQIIFIGFSLPTMLTVKRAFPRIEVCWINALRRNWRTGRLPTAENLVKKVKSAGLDGLDLNARSPITLEFVKKIHAAGLKLYVWTVDSPIAAKKLIRAGVDGITTNRPGWLRERLAAKP